LVGLSRAWYFSAIGAHSVPYCRYASSSVTAVPRMSQYPFIETSFCCVLLANGQKADAEQDRP
jgi:hypothetical protein